MMKFWLTSFYLLYVLSYVEVTATNQTFQVMALSDSGLLIFWDPATIENANKKRMTVEYRLFNESNANKSSEQVDCTYGQYKLHSALKEDSLYEINITIKQTDDDAHRSVQPSIIFKTGQKKNSMPEKPYFEWKESSDNTAPFIRITWIPCGKNRDCHGNEAGSHFAIKYKVLDLRETVTIVELVEDHRDLLFTFPGKIYEMVVVSINGDFEAESDTQEVIYAPITGPVHSIRTLVLTNTSAYLSWIKPRLSIHEETRYYFLCHISNGRNALTWSKSQFHSETALNYGYPQHRLDNLVPNTTYTFLIFPCTKLSCGFDFRYDYTFQSIQPNLKVAKPDFKIELQSMDNSSCEYMVIWMPCAETFDCKNMNPGTGFELKIENGSTTQTFTQKQHGSQNINIQKNQTYKVIGRSLDEFDRSSESVEKTITCN